MSTNSATTQISSAQQQINSKIQYGYNLIHSTINHPILQSKLANKFFRTVEKHGILLPEQITNATLNDEKISSNGKAIDILDDSNNNGGGSGLTFCRKCSSLLIPGITLNIRIKFNRKKNKNNFRERYMQYKCLNCHCVINFKNSNLIQFNTALEGKKRTLFESNLNFQDANKSDNSKNALNLSSSTTTHNNKNNRDTGGKTGSSGNTAGGNSGTGYSINKLSKNRSKKRKQMNNLSNLLNEKKKNQESNSGKDIDLFHFMKL